MRTAADPQTSRTRGKLLEAALGLMLENGYSATGVEEVCHVAKVTKGSFFHYFKSKEELGRAVLDQFYRIMQGLAAESGFRKKKDPLDRILGWIDFVIAKSRDPQMLQGCLLGTFSQELALTHEGIRQECEAKFRDWTGHLKQDLDEAVLLRRPKKKFDTRALADHLVAVLEGAIILAKARRDGRPVRESMEHLREYVSGLFAR